MTKLKWDREPSRSIMNSEYYLNPKEGFDKAWHVEQKHKQARKQKENEFLGIHLNHELERIPQSTGPHAGKLICKTCGNKFLKWLPKGSI